MPAEVADVSDWGSPCDIEVSLQYSFKNGAGGLMGGKGSCDRQFILVIYSCLMGSVEHLYNSGDASYENMIICFI